MLKPALGFCCSRQLWARCNRWQLHQCSSGLSQTERSVNVRPHTHVDQRHPIGYSKNTLCLYNPAATWHEEPNNTSLYLSHSVRAGWHFSFENIIERRISTRDLSINVTRRWRIIYTNSLETTPRSQTAAAASVRLTAHWSDWPPGPAW